MSNMYRHLSFRESGPGISVEVHALLKGHGLVVNDGLDLAAVLLEKVH